jgi:maltose-6'-phosphate glucosidase
METQKGYEKLTVEASLEGSYDKALQALLLNKMVPSYRKGKEVLDELLLLNKEYWNADFYK